MRVLICHPGSDFSVADVFNGWAKALKRNGCRVATYNMNDRLRFYTSVYLEKETGEWARAVSNDDATRLAAVGLHARIWEWQPDLILVISAFYVMSETWTILQSRPHKTAVLFTESPYEDDRQLRLVKEAEPDLVMLNDPINLDVYQAAHDNVHYFPHCYDPDVHYPGTEKTNDFVFVGTGYTSRCRFLEAVDWSGIDVKLAGYWKSLAGDSPLRSRIIHPLDVCYENEKTADLYRSARVSANLYRGNDNSEANAPDLMKGWSVGPREIELAACGTYFLREPRGEGDELFPMMPTFSDPAEFSDRLRWALRHDKEREQAIEAARLAVADRTFDASARRLLQLIGS